MYPCFMVGRGLCVMWYSTDLRLQFMQNRIAQSCDSTICHMVGEGEFSQIFSDYDQATKRD
jgi:hypothetical protein